MLVTILEMTSVLAAEIAYKLIKLNFTSDLAILVKVKLTYFLCFLIIVDVHLLIIIVVRLTQCRYTLCCSHRHMWVWLCYHSYSSAFEIQV